MELIFRSLSEDRVGATWQKVFDHGWPGWKAWYNDRADREDISVEKCRRMLRRYMPELEPTWDNWVSAVGGDPDVARFLSFWSPPRYLVGCSQIAGSDSDGPFLIRNYDLDPTLNEGTLLMSAWHGHRVIGMVEGMAGLSDGMNEAGLAMSLTFGGRIERRPGFGIPLIIRYVLQTCRDARDALEALRTIPCHMSYNVTLIDRTGQIENVMLSPDRPLMQRSDRWATNHQIDVEWPRHGRLTKTLERGRHLTALTAGPELDAAEWGLRFLAPPLHSRRYDKGFGTVYTALYRPELGRVKLMWSDGTEGEWRFDDFGHRKLTVRYGADGSSIRGGAPATEMKETGRRPVVIRNRSQSGSFGTLVEM
jgi:predicted choloylglycine hydrolase